MRIGPVIAALALGAVGALLSASPIGCATTCNTGGQDAVVYTGGDRVGPSYETTPINGTWLHFPAGRRYRLMHHLGTIHYVPYGYLAFDAHPVPTVDGGVGNFSQSAGNELIFENATADSLEVRNDTCAEYYLWVAVLPQDPSAVATDAGAD